jgi:hypothetical protein
MVKTLSIQNKEWILKASIILLYYINY